MAIHSRILDWKILWTEDPDRLQSMGSQRVGQVYKINNGSKYQVVELAFG